MTNKSLAEIAGRIKDGTVRRTRPSSINYKGVKVRIIEGVLVARPRTIRKGRREDGHGW